MSENSEGAARGVPGLWKFTLREWIVIGVGVVLLILSFFSFVSRDYAPLWGQGLVQIAALLALIAALVLLVVRRLAPRARLRVGSLSVDQFASVAFVSYAVVVWHSVVFINVLGAQLGELMSFLGPGDAVLSAGWAAWLSAVLALAGVFFTVLGPVVPPFRADFDGRDEVPAARVARPAAPVIQKPRAPQQPQQGAWPGYGAPGAQPGQNPYAPQPYAPYPQPGQDAYGQHAYGQPGQDAYGQQAPAQPGAPQPYGQQPYAQQPYGQQPYPQPYGAPQPHAPYPPQAPQAHHGQQTQAFAAPPSPFAPEQAPSPQGGAAPDAAPSASREAAPEVDEVTEAPADADPARSARAHTGSDIEASLGFGEPQEQPAYRRGAAAAADEQPDPVDAETVLREAAGGGSATEEPATAASDEADRASEGAPATSGPASRPVTNNQPFWALVPVERDVVDDSGAPLFRIGPTAWALVLEERGDVFVVRHDDGRVGYLLDTSGVTRG